MSSKTSKKLVDSELVVLNIGIDIFRQALKEQGVRCGQVDLSQAPKLDRKLTDALSKLL